jgi:hypothetical protein
MNQWPAWFNLYDRLGAALATDGAGGITLRET